MTLILTFDLDLEKFLKVKIFEAYKLKKTVKVEGESKPRCQIQNFKVKVQVTVEQKVKFT